MKSPFCFWRRFGFGLMAGLWLIAAWAAEAANSRAVKAVFAKPPRQYSSGPLWVWNDLLTEEEVVSTMRDLAKQQVKQVFVHPRPGLMTPYLSADWFRLWKVALREAARLDMNVWIYDENSYPSGFAGGFVPDAMPEARGRGLMLREVQSPQWSTNTLAVYRLSGTRGSASLPEGAPAENVSEAVRAGQTLPAGRYVVASEVRAPQDPWHAGKGYVDLLYPGVTEKFLEITLGSYKREIGGQFGKRVPGVFTDEPNIHPAGGLPWTDGLPQLFQARFGYSLLDSLPSLQRRIGDWRRVRHDYFQLLSEQFIDHWAKPYHDYCASNHLEFTGHYWEHEWPNAQGVPDNMAMYAWSQRPAIDILMNQYHEDVHAQFGNARAVRELSSVANQLGLGRTLCESYGAGGWDLRFEDMKRIGDWLYVLGVNTLDQHLSYVTLRGARKRDHPQSFSYHEPWWEAYHISASYFERLTAALTHGEQIHSILVLEPTTTAWMYNGAGPAEPRLAEIGNSFQATVMALEQAQVEYDIGCEDILARHGAVVRAAGGRGGAGGVSLVVGRRQYSTVVLPPDVENLNGKTMSLLEEFLSAGGTILCAGQPPVRVDGLLSSRGQLAAHQSTWTAISAGALPSELLARTQGSGFAINREAGDQGILFHHRRRLADGDLLFLVNTSLEHESAGTVVSRNARSAEVWDLNTGTTAPYLFTVNESGLQAAFNLSSSGSLLLFLAHEKRPAPPRVTEQVTVLEPVGTPELRRREPNVLVLDYVDITAGGQTQTNLYFYKANQFAFQKNGMGRNPWDSAVQFRDELITKKFPADSGFAVSYRFTLEGTPPKGLAIVMERPDLYTITCNGQPVAAKPGAWWLDKAFGRIELGGAARTGENVVTLEASPFTIYHEIEPAYLLGDFTLQPAARGFVVTPDQGLRFGPWNQQGHPFFSAGVCYRETFQVAQVTGQYRVVLPAWYGSVAKVMVNGKTAGYIGWPPWQCDVTRQIKPGNNVVEVLVIGTLKNTLGPHHAGAGLGSAWPSMFQTGPQFGPPAGQQYASVGYGLFEPFALQQATKAVPPAKEPK